MKVTQFEGTAEEFKVVSHLFGGQGVPTQAALAAAAEGGSPSVEPVEAVRTMLTRIPVSNGQRELYKALVDGELEYRALLERIHRTPDVMAGLLGALGRRINKTEAIHQAGLPGNVYAVIKYEQRGDGLYLSLQPHAREALVAEGIL